VQRQALQTMAPLDERKPVPTTTTLDCRFHEVWGTLVVDGVRYIEILYVADC
jgi:hypothetical protein